MTCFPYQIFMNHIKNIEKEAGVVLLYVTDSIKYWNRPDLKMAQDFIENVFIEIEINVFIEIEIKFLNPTKNAIIGWIYRVPDSNTFFQSGTITYFTKRNIKENKYI